jgi:hypothetical protein
MRVDEVRDNLYLLRGGGRTVQIGGVEVPQAGNSAVFVTSRGVVVVDTKLPGWPWAAAPSGGAVERSAHGRLSPPSGPGSGPPAPCGARRPARRPAPAAG